ncbi:MAG: DUF255 domain-containing protein [Bacteroidetes bacterium]|nr:DUF255 domain-containing protein [Bacteroidota bacterium]
MTTIRLKRLIIAAAILIISVQAGAQVKWLTIEEAEKMALKEPRPLFIDTYTDWCSWCKKLDADTFSNPVIAEILNSKFYPVKFNAEGKEPVTFKGTKFINDGKNGRTHQLAIALLQGKLGYPSMVFFNEKVELLTIQPGYLGPKDLEPLISFIAGKAYLTQNFEQFTASFKGNVK